MTHKTPSHDECSYDDHQTMVACNFQSFSGDGAESLNGTGGSTEKAVWSDSDITLRQGTILSGYSILTKSMVGSGLFVMAYGCSKFGIILGTIMIFVAAIITWISLRALSILAIEFKNEQPTFYSISEKVIPRLRWLIDVSVIVNCLGASVGYVITAGDLLSTGIYGAFGLHPVDSGLSQWKAKIIIQTVMVLSLAPLAGMKNMAGTQVANLVGLVCLLYIAITTFVYSDLSSASNDLLHMQSFLSAIGAFPKFIFAFACQMNVFQIANELKRPSVKRMNIISAASTLTGLVIYIPIMILPFLTFGRGIMDNYLRNFDSNLVPVQIAYILAAMSVSISYVLQVHPLRRSIVSLMHGGKSQQAGSKEQRERYIVTGVIIAVSFGIAVGLDQIDTVTNFTGLIGGNTLCFFMPSLLYLKYFGIKKDVFSIAVLCVFILSIILYPLCLTGIIYDMTTA
jgi:amino acid permease